ncbi:MAG: AAA family ATPase [Terracidiphilus sp.]
MEHFGFREDPFGATPDPRCLYPSNTHREALASLQYAFFSNRGFTSLIAPPGMGKTTLLIRFLEDVRNSARTAFLFDIDSQCEPRELVRHILRDLGIAPGSTAADLHAQFNRVLVEEARAGRTVVVVIDEAQNLSDGALEMVRLLTNFETPQTKLMQIVLAGQPLLAEKLRKPSLEQLRQRISTMCHLEPLTEKQIDAYIQHRLKSAGYTGTQLFTRDALSLIARASQGIPRNINNICFNALSICCALRCHAVEESMVAEAIGDLQMLPDSTTASAALRLPVVVQAHDEPAQANRQRWFVPILTPTAAAIAVGSLLGILTVAGALAPRSHQAVRASAVSSTHPPAQPSSPVPNPAPFHVIAGADQTLRDISIQYLGTFDEERLSQIRNLNPLLSDPDHIEAGRTIWLPGPRVSSVSKSPTFLAKAGNLP